MRTADDLAGVQVIIGSSCGKKSLNKNRNKKDVRGNLFSSPSYLRLPMCNIAASSFEISQFSLSVNINTWTEEEFIRRGSSIYSGEDFDAYLHRRADVGVFFHVVTAVAHRTFTLETNRDTEDELLRLLWFLLVLRHLQLKDRDAH